MARSYVGGGDDGRTRVPAGDSWRENRGMGAVPEQERGTAAAGLLHDTDRHSSDRKWHCMVSFNRLPQSVASDVSLIYSVTSGEARTLESGRELKRLVRVQVGYLLLPTTYIVQLHFRWHLRQTENAGMERERQTDRQREREREIEIERACRRNENWNGRDK